MDDMKIECMDCKNEFTLNKGEQDFYKSKGFEMPKRCKACRFKRKQQGGDRR